MEEVSTIMQIAFDFYFSRRQRRSAFSVDVQNKFTNTSEGQRRARARQQICERLATRMAGKTS